MKLMEEPREEHNQKWNEKCCNIGFEWPMGKFENFIIWNTKIE